MSKECHEWKAKLSTCEYQSKCACGHMGRKDVFAAQTNVKATAGQGDATGLMRHLAMKELPQPQCASVLGFSETVNEERMSSCA